MHAFIQDKNHADEGSVTAINLSVEFLQRY